MNKNVFFRSIFSIYLLGSFLNCLLAQQGSSFWGIRKLNLSKVDTQEILTFQPHWWMMGNRWEVWEPSKGEYNWAVIDDFYNAFVSPTGGQFEYGFDQKAQWAASNDTKDFQYPVNDLNSSLSLTEPMPDSGYSSTIYSSVFKLVEHLSTLTTKQIFINYTNEPWLEWYTGALAQAPENIDNYIRGLRTVYKAAHDAATISGSDVSVSHGAFNLDSYLLYSYYQLGEQNPLLQDSLLLLIKSRYNERTNKTYNTWNDLTVTINTEAQQKYRLWIEKIAKETNYLDHQDYHIHMKPRFMKREMEVFDELIVQSGGIPKPYAASEAAMQINNKSGFVFDENFHANDMVRKWILAMDAGIRYFSPPVIGAGSGSTFYGLYDENGIEYKASAAYRLLRNLIPSPSKINSLGSSGIYRFNFEDFKTDILWKDADFDSDKSSTLISLPFPANYNSAIAINVFGDTLETFGGCKEIILNLTQEVVVLLWDSVDVSELANEAELSPTFFYNQSGLTLNFINTSFGDCWPDSIMWDFGDGIIQSGLNPSHTYDSSGTYNTCLRTVCSQNLDCYAENVLCELIVVQNTTSAAEKKFNSNLITTYPNPSEGLVYFSSKGKSILRISVFDVVGRKLDEKVFAEIDTYSFQWNLQKYHEGIYYFEIETESGRAYERVLLKK